MAQQTTGTDQEERPYTRGRTESPYQAWQRTEGIPVHSGSFVSDLNTAEVGPWARIGQKAAFVNLAEQQYDDAWLIEIAPGGTTEPLHHLFEATYFVLSGRGATTFWYDEAKKQSVEWQGGSIFAPPLNCSYQLFNGSGDEPVRLFGVTNAPMLINIFRSTDFLFNADHAFTDRYAAEENYFSDPGTKVGRNMWKLNFVPNIRSFGLDINMNRGAGGQLTNFQISNNSMGVHCSSFPPCTYKKAHRHGAGAHVIILEGQGYSQVWREGEEPQKVDWKEGSVLSPREQEYHQHFNTGRTPARYLAFRLGNLDVRHYLPEFPHHQIEYEDEAPAVYDLYVQECAKQGATVELPRPDYRKR